MSKRFDVITVGRSSIDLYSNDIGASFEKVTSFGSFVGGCPTNIAVGTRRLGLRSALVTAVGNDPVGDFVLNFLNEEKIETSFIARKENHRTSAVVLGIQPPDKFPLVFYRENCADINLSMADVQDVPVHDAKALLVTGTALSRDPSRSANIYLMEKARRAGTPVFLDLDFRADQWTQSPAADVRAYGVTVRSLLWMVDYAIGTEEEIKAATLADADQVAIKDSQVSAPTVSGDLNEGIRRILSFGPRALVVKRGAEGARVHLQDGTIVEACPFKVDVCNVLGAGDAFASGFIYGFVHGWDWQKSLRMGNAIGAIVVTRQGCANFMPFEKEALDFIEQNGGFAPEEIPCRL